MKIRFDRYAAGENIPVQQYIHNRKLVKYFNRETAAALIASVRLLEDEHLDPNTPFYYETGSMEYESLGLDSIVDASKDAHQRFSQQAFAEKGTKAVPPLTQFKALYNMPLSFVAIEHGLTGESAVLYASASALLQQALHAPDAKTILLGSGKVFRDGAVEVGFALVETQDLLLASQRIWQEEGIELMRHWDREATQ